MNDIEISLIARRKEIEEILKKKQDAYFEARENNKPDLADEIEKEYKQLLIELRFVNPTAELDDFENALRIESKLETRRSIFKNRK